MRNSIHMLKRMTQVEAQFVETIVVVIVATSTVMFHSHAKSGQCIMLLHRTLGMVFTCIGNIYNVSPLICNFVGLSLLLVSIHHTFSFFLCLSWSNNLNSSISTCLVAYLQNPKLIIKLRYKLCQLILSHKDMSWLS